MRMRLYICRYMKSKFIQLQDHSIDEIKNEVDRFLKKNRLNKFLIVVGTYIIGKLWYF